MRQHNKKVARTLFSKNKKAKIVIVATLLAALMMLVPLYTLADGSVDIIPVGLSSSPLGESTAYSIYTAEEMQQVIGLAEDGDYSKVVLLIEEDFSIGDVSQWLPLGTSEAPFNGAIEGKEHTISGVGENNNMTLLGHLKNAYVKDLDVITAKLDTDKNPYYGLLMTAENTTIINCNIYPLGPIASRNLRALLSSRIEADTIWLESTTAGGGRSAAPVVDDANKLWAVAKGVADGTHSFLNTEITIEGIINCQNQPFDGIGNATNPFKGSIVGDGADGRGVIKDLVMSNTAPIGAGLVAYGDGSEDAINKYTTISGIDIVKTKISGKNATGALLGYGKDIVVTDCSVSGQVSGVSNVGGLVGQLELTVDGAGDFANQDSGGIALPYVNQSYSLAEVSGITNVGGLVGSMSIVEGSYPARGGTSDPIINACFTTGTINGNSQIGGIVGFAEGNASSGNGFSLAVHNSASISTITGGANVGGIVGYSDGKYSAEVDFPSVVSSYYAGTVNAMNYVGGLVGSGGDAIDSYVSGNVVSPLAFSAKALANVWPISGDDKEMYYSNVFAIQNTVHRPGDPYNKTTVGSFAAYQSANLALSGTVDKPIYADAVNDYDYFNNGGSMSGGGFTGGSVVITGNEITGTFSKLLELDTTTTPKIFKSFSEISTNAEITTFPSQFYVTSTNKATVTKGGSSEFTLPQNLGITWEINGATSINIPDQTIDGGNKVEIDSAGKLKLNAPVNKSFDAIITGISKSGISLTFPVTFMDEAIRPLLAEVPAAFTTEPNTSSAELILEANIMSLSYSEGTDATIGTVIPIDLIIYPTGNFSGAATTEVGAIKVVALNDRILKVTIDKTKLISDCSYEFDLSATGIKDIAGNTISEKFYFRTVSNSDPVISFDNTFDLYTKNDYSINSINATKDQQVIGMVENDGDYYGYLEGVEVENINGKLIDITDTTAGHIITITSKTNMSGKNGYPNLTADKKNFKAIPGEYEITYQVQDPEDNAIMSEVAKRTYKVFSKEYFTHGGLPYTTLSAMFTAGDMAAVYQDMEDNGVNVNKAVENVLISRYTKNPSDSDYIAAYHYDFTGTKVNIPIIFDTSVLTDSVFLDGFQSALNITAGKSEQQFILEIQSTAPDFEIEVDESTFVAINSLSRVQARRHFNARVRQKSTGKIVNYPLVYNFKKVNTNNYNVTQAVTITMIYPSGVSSTIAGIDLSVSKTVNVVMKRENKFKHPEDVEDIVGNFWNDTMTEVESSSKDKVLNYELTYDEASKTPSDFFIVVKNRDGKDVNMTLPTGIVLTFNSSLITKEEAFEEGLDYNLAIEPMYDVNIARDANGKAIQQFFTADELNLPGVVEVSIPLNEGLPSEKLALYYVDSETNKYNLVDYLTDKQVSGGVLNLEMAQYQGKYVITDAELAGKYVGSVN